jgi:hypothetical protein
MIVLSVCMSFRFILYEQAWNVADHCLLVFGKSLRNIDYFVEEGQVRVGVLWSREEKRVEVHVRVVVGVEKSKFLIKYNFFIFNDLRNKEIKIFSLTITWLHS